MDENHQTIARAIRALTPFSLRRASGRESPLVVEIPHAGLFVPDGPLGVHVTSTDTERRRDADLLVDELFCDAPSFGASLLVAHWSRHVIDLNRSLLDVDSGSVQRSPKPARLKHGLIWQATGKGRPMLAAPLTEQALNALLDTVYLPYHETLTGEIERKKKAFGHAIVLAAHSMPSTDASGNLRADIVPGTCGRTTASPRVIETVEHLACEHLFGVRHDDPYRGGYTTQTTGKPLLQVSAIQIEINRGLYMNESTQTAHEQWGRVRTFANALMGALAVLT